MAGKKSRFYADLHVHSKYSRATSRDCDLEGLACWAKRKGISVVGTGDFTHPAWNKELHDKLQPAEPGLYRLRDEIWQDLARRHGLPSHDPPRFMLSVEISTIYKKGDKTRKIHHLIYAPDLEHAGRISRALGKIGNITSDGRPILGLDSRHLLEIVLEAGADNYLVPAHIWTPWFAVLGSKSGFDAVADCYGDLAEHIFAVETGLSSDPPMNWRVKSLDRYTLVSNSDAHSPSKLGREACVFETEMDYFAMRRALETRQGYGGTVEFFPEEGKYHLDGHRKCGVVLEPSETKEVGGKCPVCGRDLTLGVMHRVQALADRHDDTRPESAAPFRSFVPLPEILAEIAGVGAKSKTVNKLYHQVLLRLGSELDVLDTTATVDVESELAAFLPGRVAAHLGPAIERMRSGDVQRIAGYDGEYGVIRLFRPNELDPVSRRQFALWQKQQPADAAAEPLASKTLANKTLPRQRKAAKSNPADIETPVEAAAAASPPPVERLDPEQRAAVEHRDGPLLIIAGPGTGKTRTLTHRIAHLIADCGVAAEACLAITFTNRAAGEMRERLGPLLPDTSGASGASSPSSFERGLQIGTFHSVALAMLRQHRERAGLPRGFAIANEAERIALLASALECSTSKARSGLGKISRATMQAAVAAVAACVEALSTPSSPSEVESATAGAHRLLAGQGVIAGDDAAICAEYRRAMEEASLVDFDDLMIMATALLASDDDVRAYYQNRFGYIFIDEYQDIDALQYLFVRLLCLGDRKDVGATPTQLCAIGDPDQAIYSFRGADVGFFMRFRQDFPDAREIHLSRNYRSSATIVRAAMAAIAPMSLMPKRQLCAVATDKPAAPSSEGGREEGVANGQKILLAEVASERAEAEFVVHTIESLIGGTSFFSIDSERVHHHGEDGPAEDLSFADFAILYRVESQRVALAEALSRAGIPFQQRAHGRLSERGYASQVVQVARTQMNEATDESMNEVAGDVGNIVGFLRRAATSLAEQLEPEEAVAKVELDMALELLCAAAEQFSEHDDRQGSGQYPQPSQRDARAKAAAFFDRIALESEIDTLDPRADRVALLTLHAAKGLEFPVVFMVGCEDGIMPLRWGRAQAASAPSLATPRHDIPDAARGRDSMSEERRLCFVGMTRARSLLYLSRARKRRWRGEVRELVPAPFLSDIDADLIQAVERGSKGRGRRRLQGHEQLGLF